MSRQARNCERSKVSGVAIVAISRWAHGRLSKKPRHQPTAIFVSETQPTSTKLTPQEAALFDQVRAW